VPNPTHPPSYTTHSIGPLDVPLQDRVPTASERIYRELLNAATEEKRANLEGQLVAICIAACRHRLLAPPYEWQPHPEHEYLKGRWVGGRLSLPSWVRQWVNDQLSAQKPLEDCARFIGRRCVNALIDEIRWHERRKRGAQSRNRKDDPLELERQRAQMQEVLSDIGLPDRLHIAGDKSLLTRLMAAYPTRLSNASNRS
jgi:hypothetical protein